MVKGLFLLFLLPPLMVAAYRQLTFKPEVALCSWNIAIKTLLPVSFTRSVNKYNKLTNGEESSSSAIALEKLTVTLPVPVIHN